MSSKIDPELREKLRGPGDLPLNIKVEFLEPPQPQEIQALGLHLEGLCARGALSRQRIEALELIPQVKSVKLSEPLPSASGRAQAQLGARLELELQDANRTAYDVGVTFRGPVKSPSDFPYLSIYVDIGRGHLTKEQIYELAKREDVLSIETIPPVQLH